jgi:hypothetical protein
MEEKTNKEKWLELCFWIEKNILGYDENQHMQTRACLSIRGLQKGQVVGNNNAMVNGNYSYEVILNTFKYCKNSILRGLRGKNFQNENQKIAYACAIVRSNINTIYTKMKNIDSAREKIKSIEVEHLTNEVADYQKRSVDNTKFNDMW